MEPLLRITIVSLLLAAALVVLLTMLPGAVVQVLGRCRAATLRQIAAATPSALCACGRLNRCWQTWRAI